jgi:hypothetical protein
MPPPPAPAWSEEETGKLRAFLSDLYARLHATDTRLDEQFPPELQDRYTGKRTAAGPDNTFLTYYQLRRKIDTLFGDNWQRGDRDLFRENLAQFGGADFERRFNESSKASATFLSALDSLSQDVASRAYLSAGGPFAGRAQTLPSPTALTRPDVRYRAEISRLYQRLLFRSPSESELQQAFGFLRDIYRHQSQQSAAAHREETTLDFELVARDERGRETRRAVRLPVAGGQLGLRQQYLDQSLEEGEAKARLTGEFQLKAGDPGSQRFEISNEATTGNVSLAAIELTGPLPALTSRRIGIEDSSVVLEGAWQRRNEGGLASYEDQDNNKGASRIVIPLAVKESGKYAITVFWRRAEVPAAPMGRRRRNRFRMNARAVPVSVYSHDVSTLANPELPEIPPPGEAHFVVDQTLDTIPSWDLKSAFLFADTPDQGVEFRNEGTRKRVVADSVRFQPAPGSPSEAKEFLLDDPLAEGGWPQFKIPDFRPYNLVGKTALTDENQRKGEMRLLYRPARSTDWRAEALYHVFVGFPGQVDNETQVPIVVKARESTPIVQLSAPLRAAVGATVTLDGSASYNVQRTPLRYTWIQNGGPRVQIADRHAPKLSFTVTPITPQQAAWEGLCRALMSHPDFLFTRPRALTVQSGAKLTPADRRRLQLVKVAQDLVGRPPTAAEVARLDGGTPLVKLVDSYLSSQEFRDFYFHRIRLVLESHGTEQDDEPVRLWCYIAFNNRPFKEILTADYTVDAALKQQPRPPYHGRTGLLTMKGFIQGKPGLPHFNYAAMVTEKFLGYVYEVPPSIVAMREGITAVATTSPTSACYSCHKILTPLAYQRLAWNDDGSRREKTEAGQPVDDTDRGLVANYPYRGKGMEAFALQAVNKERFLRTIFQTHFVMLFGREMRYQAEERALYRRLWDNAHRDNFRLLGLLKTLVTSPEYLNGGAAAPAPKRPAPRPARRRVARK